MLIFHRTLDYAAPPSGHFWRWSLEGDAIEWNTGGTLALWPEVHTILREMQPSTSLPPFGSLLLLVAACRDDWDAMSEAFAIPLLESILNPNRGASGSVPERSLPTSSNICARSRNCGRAAQTPRGEVPSGAVDFRELLLAPYQRG